MEGTKLFVGGIPAPNASEEQVRELFEQHLVTPYEVVILPPKGSNQETRCGFVRVPEEMADATCEAMNGMAFEGFSAPMVLRRADNKQQSHQPGAFGGGGGAAAYVAPPLRAPPSAGGYVDQRASGGLAGGMDSPTAQKERAKAEGNWLEAAEWMEQEYAGESYEQRIGRLRQGLIAAAVEERFYEAASLQEALNQIDPEAAASANQAAASAASGTSNGSIHHVNPSMAARARAQAASLAAVHRPRGVVVMPGQARVVLPQHMAPPPASTDSYEGCIISFKPEKNFGFIQSQQLGCDAFLSSKQLGSFNVGEQVLFDVTYNAQGKPQAQNLRPLESSFNAPAKRQKVWS